MLAVVTRPRAASALAGLVVAVAAASVLLSAAWLGLPAAGAALAALALLVGLLHSLRGGLSPVSALRASLRRPLAIAATVGLARRRPAALEQGPAWLTLTLQPLPSGSMAFTRSNYTFTVWRRALRPDAWRRLCLLLAQAEPRAAAPAAPREAQ